MPAYPVYQSCSSGTGYTVNPPAANTGDLILVYVNVYNTGTTPAIANFTTAGVTTGPINSQIFWVGWKLYQGEGSFTISGTGLIGWMCLRISGVSIISSNIVDVVAYGSYPNNIIGNITTNQPNDLLLFANASANNFYNRTYQSDNNPAPTGIAPVGYGWGWANNVQAAPPSGVSPFAVWTGTPILPATPNDTGWYYFANTDFTNVSAALRKSPVTQYIGDANYYDYVTSISYPYGPHGAVSYATTPAVWPGMGSGAGDTSNIAGAANANAGGWAAPGGYWGTHGYSSPYASGLQMNNVYPWVTTNNGTEYTIWYGWSIPYAPWPSMPQAHAIATGRNVSGALSNYWAPTVNAHLRNPDATTYGSNAIGQGAYISNPTGWGQIASAEGTINIQMAPWEASGAIGHYAPTSFGAQPYLASIYLAIKGSASNAISVGGLGIEYAYTTTPTWRLTQQSADVASISTSEARVTQAAVEILRSFASSTSHTTDIFQLYVITKSHFTDVEALKTWDDTYHTTDINFAFFRWHTTDTETIGAFTSYHYTDTFLQGTYIPYWSNDVFVVHMYTIHHTTDLYTIKLNIRQYHTIDTSVFQTVTPYYYTDTFLKGTYTPGYITDILLHGTVRAFHTTDIDILYPGATYHSTDLLSTGSAKKQHYTDIFKQGTYTPRHYTDTFKQATYTPYHYTDTYALYIGTLYHHTDVVPQKIGILKHTTNVVAGWTNTLSYYTDVYPLYIGSQLHTTDIDILGNVVAYHTTDTSIIQLDNNLLHTTDTYSLPFRIVNHTTDTELYGIKQRLHTTDVVVFAPTISVPKQYKFTYIDDYGTVYTNTWTTTANTINTTTMDITTITEQPYVWGEPAAGYISDRQLYRKGIVTIQRMIIESNNNGYKIRSEGNNQYIGDILTSFNCADPSINPFKYILNNAVNDDVVLQVEDGNCYTFPDDTMNIVWADVNPDGTIVPSDTGDINLEYIDIWTN